MHLPIEKEIRLLTNLFSFCYLTFCTFTCPYYALVAQSVEHHHGKVGVSGSNPLGGLRDLGVLKKWRLQALAVRS